MRLGCHFSNDNDSQLKCLVLVNVLLLSSCTIILRLSTLTKVYINKNLIVEIVKETKQNEKER